MTHCSLPTLLIYLVRQHFCRIAPESRLLQQMHWSLHLGSKTKTPPSCNVSIDKATNIASNRVSLSFSPRKIKACVLLYFLTLIHGLIKRIHSYIEARTLGGVAIPIRMTPCDIYWRRRSRVNRPGGRARGIPCSVAKGHRCLLPSNYIIQDLPTVALSFEKTGTGILYRFDNIHRNARFLELRGTCSVPVEGSLNCHIPYGIARQISVRLSSTDQDIVWPWVGNQASSGLHCFLLLDDSLVSLATFLDELLKHG
mmetsp:Transcript_5570/g.8341  ORF Transcript_5570/g.8341 Transcript_5570/m.8341 type:complete len:255 (+) Transcript_5570:293-1057(+)